MHLVKKQLEKIFVESTVSIGGCSLKPTQSFRFSNLEIKRQPAYSLKVKEAGIRYDLFSLLKGRLLKFYLKDATVSLNLPRESLAELPRYVNLNSSRSGLFTIGTIEFSNLNLNLKLKGLRLQAELSAEVNGAKQLLNNLSLKIDSLASQDFHLNDCFFKVRQNQSEGSFSIHRLQYNKLKIDALKAEARLLDKLLFLDSLSARLFSGHLQADAAIRLDENNGYLLNLKFINLDAETFVEDFNLNEKVEMRGKIGGQLTLQGRGLDIQAVRGDFSDSAGGVLTIKDTKFLENIARSSQQPLDLLVESFKDYHYNKAMMIVYFDKGNLNFDIAMDSETGKRSLSITIHDFRLWRR